MGQAYIRLRRIDRYQAIMRKFNVILDGKRIDKIKNGDELVFVVEPGEHTLRLRLDWDWSPKQQFSLQDGETIIFVCEWSRKFLAHDLSLERE